MSQEPSPATHCALIAKLKHVLAAIEEQAADGRYPRLLLSENGGEGVMPIYDAIRALECAPSETPRFVPVPNPPSTVSPCSPHNVVACDRCAAVYWQAMYDSLFARSATRESELPPAECYVLAIHQSIGSILSSYSAKKIMDRAKEIQNGH